MTHDTHSRHHSLLPHTAGDSPAVPRSPDGPLLQNPQGRPGTPTRFQGWHQAALDFIHDAHDQLTEREFLSLMDILQRRATYELGGDDAA